MNPHASAITDALEASDESHSKIYLELHRQRLKGRVSHEDVLGIYKENNQGLALNLTKKWHDGSLFPSQKMPFMAWLELGFRDWEHECRRASESLATLENFDQVPAGFLLYITTRIWTPGLGQRKNILDAGQGSPLWEAFSRDWGIKNQKHDWNWQ